MDTSEIAQKLPKQSVPVVYSVILKYEETHEAESKSKLTTRATTGVHVCALSPLSPLDPK